MIQTRSGRFNGFGGKVEIGETPAQAAARELKVRAIKLVFRLTTTDLLTSVGRSWH
jgi:hypothetical protein